MAPGELSNTTCALSSKSKQLIVGFEGNEDAAVYRINDDLALVQTVDFITPVVDDPFIYGQIAAANSLSDIFAMGAEVKAALNLVGFDSLNHSKEILNEILKGGESKVIECGGVIVGGHTIETQEMLYGLSVTGFIKPDKVFRNNTVKPGDVIILTKPIGLGILTTALKADLLTNETIYEIIEIMATLNFKASQIARRFPISACTDVTGFGLLGHIYEMSGENYNIEIFFEKVPYIKESINQAAMGIIPSGSYANKEFLEPKVEFKKKLTFEQEMLLYDAQTSGGLLIAIKESKSMELLTLLNNEGISSSIIAQVENLSINQKIITVS